MKDTQKRKLTFLFLCLVVFSFVLAMLEWLGATALAAVAQMIWG